MLIVMICDFGPVAFVDLTKEAREFHLVQLLKLINVEDLKDVDRHDRECSFATKLTAELECVKVDLLSVRQMQLVLLNVINDGVKTGRPTTLRYRIRHIFSLLQLLDVGVDRGFAQEFEAHLTVLIQPALSQRRPALQG